jgi:hypothetical protein
MIAGNDIHVIVGEFAPLLPDHAFDLLPVPCDLIPVHDLYICICSWIYRAERSWPYWSSSMI